MPAADRSGAHELLFIYTSNAGYAKPDPSIKMHRSRHVLLLPITTGSIMPVALNTGKMNPHEFNIIM
jgi:hypothetical protein